MRAGEYPGGRTLAGLRERERSILGVDYDRRIGTAVVRADAAAADAEAVRRAGPHRGRTQLKDTSPVVAAAARFLPAATTHTQPESEREKRGGGGEPSTGEPNMSGERHTSILYGSQPLVSLGTFGIAQLISLVLESAFPLTFLLSVLATPDKPNVLCNVYYWLLVGQWSRVLTVYQITCHDSCNRVGSDVVRTNRTMVSSDTDINRTGVLVVLDIGDSLLICLKFQEMCADLNTPSQLPKEVVVLDVWMLKYITSTNLSAKHARPYLQQPRVQLVISLDTGNHTTSATCVNGSQKTSSSMTCKPHSTFTCTLEPQMFVLWLLPHSAPRVTSYLAAWDSLLVSLQVCYWLRVVQDVSSELRSKCKADFNVHVFDVYLVLKSTRPMRVIESNMEQRRNERVGGKREIPERTRRPAASPGSIPTCENPVMGTDIWLLQPNAYAVSNKQQQMKCSGLHRGRAHKHTVRIEHVASDNCIFGHLFYAGKFQDSLYSETLELRSHFRDWKSHFAGVFSRITDTQCRNYLVLIGPVIVKTTRLAPRRARFGFRRIFARGNRWSAGFLRDLPFPPPLHSGAASYSPRFTLIGSQDNDVKSRPNLFTHSTHLLRLATLQHALANSTLILRSKDCLPAKHLPCLRHAEIRVIIHPRFLNFSEALLKFYLQDIPPPRASKAYLSLGNYTIEKRIEFDKIDVQHVHTEVSFAIGSQFIRHALVNTEPIADVQGNKWIVESNPQVTELAKSSYPLPYQRQNEKRNDSPCGPVRFADLVSRDFFFSLCAGSPAVEMSPALRSRAPGTLRQSAGRRKSDEALAVRYSVARIAPSLLDLGRAVPVQTVHGKVSTFEALGYFLFFQPIYILPPPDVNTATLLKGQCVHVFSVANRRLTGYPTCIYSEGLVRKTARVSVQRRARTRKAFRATAISRGRFLPVSALRHAEPHRVVQDTLVRGRGGVGGRKDGEHSLPRHSDDVLAANHLVITSLFIFLSASERNVLHESEGTSKTKNCQDHLRESAQKVYIKSMVHSDSTRLMFNESRTTLNQFHFGENLLAEDLRPILHDTCNRTWFSYKLLQALVQEPVYQPLYEPPWKVHITR
ncbi:hypothetical protein PR048_033351 [Dryococelus australis]|uniref:Uncharacterized protein n=1 Tax=Dryococelus australis TaxID=614101 RepID=A0ABQ9G477_9NEOP|nr:hypothetical protein PR048_033351 [Dryococelus australis]